MKNGEQWRRGYQNGFYNGFHEAINKVLAILENEIATARTSKSSKTARLTSAYNRIAKLL